MPLKEWKLPPPQIIEEPHFETILKENVDLLKKVLPDWLPHESDPFMPLLQAFSYKEIFLRQRINQAIRALLLPYSQGSDLDNLAVFYGVRRLPGVCPTALYEWSLSSPLMEEVLIPQGLTLVSDRQERAVLEESLVIPPGEMTVRGKVSLMAFVATSEARPERITTPLPFLLRAKKMTPFTGGSPQEKDEALVERILLSLERFSTAGSKESYIYHARSSDPRLKDVKVDSSSPGVVEVYFLAPEMDEQMQEGLQKALSDKKVRPLTDWVKVRPASLLPVDIELTVSFKDMLLAHETISKIKTNLRQIPLGIKDTLFLSWIYKNADVDNVFDVQVQKPKESVIPGKAEAIWIRDITITPMEIPKGVMDEL